MPAFRRVWRVVHSRAQAAAARSAWQPRKACTATHTAGKKVKGKAHSVQPRVLRDVRGTSRLPLILTSGVGGVAAPIAARIF